MEEGDFQVMLFDEAVPFTPGSDMSLSVCLFCHLEEVTSESGCWTENR